MKILFTADWHIKTSAKDVPTEWAKAKFRKMFTEINRVEKLADIHIIGGDIFDKLPNMDEIELYYEFVASARIPTVIYPGNHEALKKSTTFLTQLKKSTNTINPLVRIVDYIDSSLLGGDIDIIPYNELKDWVANYQDYDFQGRILCTHVRGEIPPHVKPEIPLQLLDRWEVVLAGDLHSYANSQRNILYPGSPTTTSFHRSLVSTGCIILDVESLQHEFLEFDVPQLIRRSVKVGEPTPATDYHYTVYEVEGSLEELANLEDSTNITKKVPKKSSDTALILDPKLSMVEELREYLTYIAGLDEDTIVEILNEFNSNAATI